MIKNIIKATASLIFLFNLMTTTSAAEMVTAKGMSFFEPGRETIAREKALDEAKRTAVEKVFGVYVQSRTHIENFQTVRDKILQHSSGYLHDVEILNENRSESGIYEVTIQAEANPRNLVDDVDRLQQLINQRKNPRLLIKAESGIKKEHRSLAAMIKSVLATKLQQHDFVLLSPHQNTKLVLAGLIIEIFVDATTHISNYKGLDIQVNDIGLSASIVRPGEGTILATTSDVVTLAGVNVLQQRRKAAEQCVQKVWSKLRLQLLRTWEAEQFGLRDILFEVHQIPTYEKAQNIARRMRSKLQGVKDSVLLDYRKNTATISLKYRGKTDFLVNQMHLSFFKKEFFDFTVIEVSSNKIVVNKMQGGSLE